ncbi:MAG: carbonic anhydrase family protein [Polaribacter sp.]
MGTRQKSEIFTSNCIQKRELLKTQTVTSNFSRKDLKTIFKSINMKAHTKETQNSISPKQAVELLKEGNQRFMANKKASRNLLEQVEDTSTGQYPFATILSCIDSRVSSELIFDQGIGDIFSVRIAGNFVNEDILGSMEFACRLAGTKVIVVLGHTSCGAVKGACDDAKLGNLTTMLAKIKPAVEAVNEPSDQSLRNSKNIDFVNDVAKKNVELTIDNIRKQSPVLQDMEDAGEIEIVGAMYDINDGSVTFY